MYRLFVTASAAAVLSTGAIFGFFYAWVCSTMWGLDDAAPHVAIEAMRAMNASVRNIVFAPAFFATPFVLVATAALARRLRLHRAALFFLAAGLVYLVGGMVLTLAINVPLNDALAAATVPGDTAGAQRVWDDYSGRWQAWNLARTVASGLALLLATVGVAVAAAGRAASMPGAASHRGV